MRSKVEGWDLSNKCRILGMWWMNVGWLIWDLCGISLLGGNGLQGVLLSRRDLIGAMANNEWISSFPATKVVHLEGIPVRRQKPWRFEQVWLGEEGCHETVRFAWRSGVSDLPMVVVEEKLKQCQTKLQWLNRVSFGNIVRSLVDKKSALKLADNSNKWRWAWYCL